MNSSNSPEHRVEILKQLQKQFDYDVEICTLDQLGKAAQRRVRQVDVAYDSSAVVATLISGRNSLIPAIVIGIFFTVGGVANLSSIPHPAWFPVVDLPLYLLLAVVAGKMLRKPTPEAVQPKQA